jgi:DNA-binding NarL/FixJ family response regulator
VGALPSTQVFRAHPPSGPSLRSYHTEKNEHNRHSRNLACVKYILIVDDSPLVRRCLRDLLEQESGWSVCGEAENGQDGIDKALQLHPDLIVLDLAMPVMNGIEAARELKRLMAATPLLMFTTYTDSHLIREALAVGVAAVAAKSDGAEALVSDIRQLFRAVA